MLKLNYNDYGLFLEHVTASLDAVATQRVMLAVYAGETLHLEPGRAAFLVSADATGVNQLKSVLQKDATQTVTLTGVDDEFVEVSLKGTWIANSANAEAGTFITALTPVSEALIYQLWQVTHRQSAYVF
ncbi:MAG: alr0857 family protein [Cyanobacteria bacterium P01_C01_bin.69]